MVLLKTKGLSMTECNKCSYPLVGGTCDNGCEQQASSMVLMPAELTAENGAKALLIGEFHVKTQVPNPDYDPCLDDDDEDEEPEFFTAHIAVPWNTIKAIYAMAVKHLSKPLDDSPFKSPNTIASSGMGIPKH